MVAGVCYGTLLVDIYIANKLATAFYSLQANFSLWVPSTLMPYFDLCWD